MQKQVVRTNQVTPFEIDRSELAHKVAFAAIELSKVVNAVGGVFPQLSEVMTQSQKDSFQQLNRIADAWFSHDQAGNKVAQVEAKDAITNSLSIASWEVFSTLDRLMSELRDVATKADALGAFDSYQATSQEFSRECLTFIGSLHSAVRDNKDIIAFKHYRVSQNESVNTYNALNDKLYDLTASLYASIQELSGEIVIFALRDIAPEAPETQSLRNDESCTKAKEMIRHTLKELNKVPDYSATPVESTELRALRVALSSLEYVVDEIHNRDGRHRPLEKSLRGLHRTTSEILTELVPVTGDVQHLVAGALSTHKSTVEHSLEQVCKIGPHFDLLLAATSSSLSEEAKLLTARDHLITTLQTAITKEENSVSHLYALTRLGLAGLDAVKAILLRESSSAELKNNCLDTLHFAVHSRVGPSAMPAAYTNWFRDLAGSLKALDGIPELEDKRDAMKRALLTVDQLAAIEQ